MCNNNTQLRAQHEETAQGAARRHSTEGVPPPFYLSSFVQDSVKVYYRYLAHEHAHVTYHYEEDNWLIKP